MQKVTFKKLKLFQFHQLSKFPSIRHFVTCKNKQAENSFSLSLSSVKNAGQIVKNRELLAGALNISTNNFVFQQQDHTKNVTTVSKVHKGRGFYKYKDGFTNNDAMVTAEKEICLMIMGADCVPILFYDPVKEVIGAAHAGWRGTVQCIAKETIKTMENQFDCKPQDIIAAIGPSIGPDNYEVDDLVYDAFAQNFDYAHELFIKVKKQGKYLLDLWKANQTQLLSAGIKAEHLEISGICTFENHYTFFSARKGDSGRFSAGIMMS